MLPRAAGVTRVLFAASAVATPLTMALAVWWALGEAADLPHLTLTQTAATHGVLNALAVASPGSSPGRGCRPPGCSPTARL